MNARPLILGLGEILWDVFPDGPRFGGAPANFVCSAAGLAADSVDVGMISAVGNDDLGRAALRALQDHHVSTMGVVVNHVPTGQVNVLLDQRGHASYEFAANVAWDHLHCTPQLEELARSADVLCFGTLGQRSDVSRRAIQQIVAASRSECLRIFDINLRPPFWTEPVIRESLALANVLKLNDDELPQLATMLNLTGAPDAQLQTLIQRYDLRLAALTRGAGGALLINRQGDVGDLPGVPTEVRDTVGAGDSYTAALAIGSLQRRSLDDINHWAGQVAAYVCSQPGATPVIPDRLKSPIAR